MNKNLLGQRIKELRKQKGMSQEYLAEESGLSLRTIQRIENGETNPTGESLKRLSNALNVNPDELIDWSVKVDKRYLTFLNLSALTFLFFPLLGILIPFILWTARKGKIKNINKLGKDLINFEITWTLLLFSFPFLWLLLAKIGLLKNLTLSIIFIIVGVMYFINFIFILLNTLRISNENDETSEIIIQNFTEQFIHGGTFKRSYFDKDRNPFNETGEWQFDENQSQVKVTEVSSVQFTDETSTVSSSDYNIKRLNQSIFWYTYQNGGDFHEFQFAAQ